MLTLGLIRRALDDVDREHYASSPEVAENAADWIAGRTNHPERLLSVERACEIADLSIERVRREAVLRQTGRPIKSASRKTLQRFGLTHSPALTDAAPPR